jgi:GDP-L-fucose synthase
MFQGKSLVTGGKGFIGKNLNVDVKISRKDADLLDYKQTYDIIKKHKPDTVIHCAALHTGFMDLKNNHSDFLRHNITMDMNVIEVCKELGVKNLLMISSTTSFPANTQTPYIEDYFFQGDVDENTYGYSFSKKVNASLVKSYQKQYGLNYKSVILGNVYGPHNYFNEKSTVVSNLIYKCFEAKTKNKPFEIYGDGSPKRDFVYVDDLNTIFKNIIESKELDPTIVSSGEVIDIKTLIVIIVKHLNYDGEVVWGNQKNMGVVNKYCDNTKLKSILNKSFNFTPIDEGIKKTCEWYVSRDI